MLLHEDRLFPAEAGTLKIARALYAHIQNLPIISPHGHTQASWFSRNTPFPDPATLFVQPDHYVFRMLYSQGVSLDDLDIGQSQIKDPRKVWRTFAQNYYLFRGTPTRVWLDYSFQELFGFEERLSEKNADHYYDVIDDKLSSPNFLPRALFERSTLRCFPPPIPPPTRWTIIKAIHSSGWNKRDSPRLPARSGRRSRLPWICRPHCQTRSADRRRHVNLDRLSECPAQGACPLQASWAAQPPTTATPPPKPPTFPGPMLRNSSARCFPAKLTPRSRNSSGRRCSPRWRR